MIDKKEEKLINSLHPQELIMIINIGKIVQEKHKMKPETSFVFAFGIVCAHFVFEETSMNLNIEDIYNTLPNKSKSKNGEKNLKKTSLLLELVKKLEIFYIKLIKMDNKINDIYLDLKNLVEKTHKIIVLDEKTKEKINKQENIKLNVKENTKQTIKQEIKKKLLKKKHSLVKQQPQKQQTLKTTFMFHCLRQGEKVQKQTTLL